MKKIIQKDTIIYYVYTNGTIKKHGKRTVNMRDIGLNYIIWQE